MLKEPDKPETNLVKNLVKSFRYINSDARGRVTRAMNRNVTYFQHHAFA